MKDKENDGNGIVDKKQIGNLSLTKWNNSSRDGKKSFVSYTLQRGIRQEDGTYTNFSVKLSKDELLLVKNWIVEFLPEPV